MKQTNQYNNFDIRLQFGNNTIAPDLLEIPLNSYNKFLYGNKNEKSGLEKELLKIFPIYNSHLNFELKYISYKLGNSISDKFDLLWKVLTYAAPLLVKVLLCIYPNKSENNQAVDNEDYNDKTIYVEEEIYICDIPLMTENGSFIINGLERAVISQIQKCPGVFFGLNHGLYNAKIIPKRGSWLDFEFDMRDNIYFKIDKSSKMPITYLLRALNYSTEDMLNIFDQHILIKLSPENQLVYIHLDYDNILGNQSDFNIKHNNILYVKKGEIITNEHIELMRKDNLKWVQISRKEIIGKRIAKQYRNSSTGQIICEANSQIKEILLRNLEKNNITEIIIVLNDKNYISQTLNSDKTEPTKENAIKQIKYNIKSFKFHNKDINIIEDLLFNKKKYDLSDVGRIKINQSFKNINENKNILTKQDIILTLKKLIQIKKGTYNIDDIDHLGNKIVKSVGDMVQHLLGVTLYKMSAIIKDKTYLHVPRTKLCPTDLIHFKLISAGIKDFYSLNSLSQFLDQTNPLSELTHKRRLSSLGTGGVNRDRASFDVRDIHPTHYGRICPIETPEGPNIGLINSFSLYVKINKYGFLLTPYKRVIKGHVSNKIDYLSPIDEYNYIIAHADEKLDINNNFISNKILCRYNFDIIECNQTDVNYIDVSTTQIFSLGATTIPFMDNNDANRALMGANMQRQAVPLMITESPLVGTGIEKQIAVDSKVTITAKRSGIVHYVDNNQIMIKLNKNELVYKYSILDVYKLNKNLRSNQNTCINQKPIVMIGDKVKKGDIIADGPATSRGELSLGKNLRVAFMSWHGYCFEDSIVISEKVLQEQTLTSVHLYRYDCVVKDHKLGVEKVTTNIPFASKLSISHLDETGIANIGSVVKEGDIIVGKISPKDNMKIPPEDLLLKHIFSEPALYFNDTSFRVPKGIYGTVVDIQILSRKGEENKIMRKHKEKIFKKNYKYLINAIYEDIYAQLNYLIHYDEVKSNHVYKNMLLKKKHNFNDINYLLSVKFNNSEINVQLKIIKQNLKILINKYIVEIKKEFKKLNYISELPIGVKQIIKITLAQKKNIQAGDKFSGRHGNKGVIAKICKIEDMPYDEYGNTIDVILNPLGVPSRMNVGQLLETKLGLVLKTMGNVIQKLLSDNKIEELKGLLHKIYSLGNKKINICDFSNKEIINISNKLINGVPVANPVFSGIKEDQINEMFKLLSLPQSGQIYLYDGCTGEKFERPITVGYMYMLKLNHLVDDKIHARSTGTYSIVTQQPLGGKSQFGGQRVGEMEVWALEAYGAAYILQEMLTVKSDDFKGRISLYKNIFKHKYELVYNLPHSFQLLIKELMSLCLNVELIDEKKINYIKNKSNLKTSEKKEEKINIDFSDENVFKLNDLDNNDVEIDFKELDEIEKKKNEVLIPKPPVETEEKKEEEEEEKEEDDDNDEYLKYYQLLDTLNTKIQIKEKRHEQYIKLINRKSKHYIAIYKDNYIKIQVKKV